MLRSREIQESISVETDLGRRRQNNCHYAATGAGDTAIAAFSAAVASGADLGSAAQLANLSAGIKVGKRGTPCADLEEIRASLNAVRIPHDSV